MPIRFQFICGLHPGEERTVALDFTGNGELSLNTTHVTPTTVRYLTVHFGLKLEVGIESLTRSMSLSDVLFC